jgi:hypothetical protein
MMFSVSQNSFLMANKRKGIEVLEITSKGNSFEVVGLENQFSFEIIPTFSVFDICIIMCLREVSV